MLPFRSVKKHTIISLPYIWKQTLNKNFICMNCGKEKYEEKKNGKWIGNQIFNMHNHEICNLFVQHVKTLNFTYTKRLRTKPYYILAIYTGYYYTAVIRNKFWLYDKPIRKPESRNFVNLLWKYYLKVNYYT